MNGYELADFIDENCKKRVKEKMVSGLSELDVHHALLLGKLHGILITVQASAPETYRFLLGYYGPQKKVES